MPCGEPDAYWALLGPEIQLFHTRYELMKTAERIRSTSYPQANDFAQRNVLQRLSAAEMLAFYSKLELQH